MADFIYTRSFDMNEDDEERYEVKTLDVEHSPQHQKEVGMTLI